MPMRLKGAHTEISLAIPQRLLILNHGEGVDVKCHVMPSVNDSGAYRPMRSADKPMRLPPLSLGVLARHYDSRHCLRRHHDRINLYRSITCSHISISEVVSRNPATA